jgi:hypothetical protein
MMRVYALLSTASAALNLKQLNQRYLKDGVEAIHASLTAVPAWICLDLAINPVFQLIPTSYCWWAAHGTQDYWSGWALIMASIGFLGLISRNKFIRLFSATTLGVGHACIATGFLLSVPSATGVGVYFILAGLAVWRIYLEGRLWDGSAN